MLPVDLRTRFAVAVVSVGVACGSGKAVFLIVSVALSRRRGIESHVARCVILVIRAGSMDPVVGVSGDAQAFRTAFGHGFLQQVAPSVIPVAVAPVLALAADHRGGTVCSRVLRRDQAVELVVGEGLIAVLVLVIRDTLRASVLADRAIVHFHHNRHITRVPAQPHPLRDRRASGRPGARMPGIEAAVCFILCGVTVLSAVLPALPLVSNYQQPGHLCHEVGELPD